MLQKSTEYANGAIVIYFVRLAHKRMLNASNTIIAHGFNVLRLNDTRRPAIAQLVEHLTVVTSSNQMVPGSIPGGRIDFVIFRHCAQHHPAKLCGRRPIQAESTVNPGRYLDYTFCCKQIPLCATHILIGLRKRTQGGSNSRP
jgi:hypothetical protein